MDKNIEKITVEVSGEAWQKALESAYKKEAKNIAMPGFRKGNAPMEMYVKKNGLKALYEPAARIASQNAYAEALEKASFEPIVQPNVLVTAVDDEKAVIEYELMGKPEIKLKKYKNLGIKKEEVEVTKEEVEDEIQYLREQFTEVKLKDGAIENNDTAIIDFVGTLDGEEFNGGKGENYPLVIGSHTFIPGFEEALIGMKSGEEKDIPLTFPEDYVESLAGKDVVFHVTVHEVKTKVLPEIDKDFFQDLGYEDINTKDELIIEVEKVLKDRKQQEADNRFLNEVLEEAVSGMEVEIPEKLLEEEKERIVKQLEQKLKYQNVTLEQYLQFAGQTIDGLKDSYEETAIHRIKERFLLEEVMKLENIDVTPEEVEKDVEEMANNYGISKEALIEAYGGMDLVTYDSKMRKTLHFLVDNN